MLQKLFELLSKMHDELSVKWLRVWGLYYSFMASPSVKSFLQMIKDFIELFFATLLTYIMWSFFDFVSKVFGSWHL